MNRCASRIVGMSTGLVATPPAAGQPTEPNRYSPARCDIQKTNQQESPKCNRRPKSRVLASPFLAGTAALAAAGRPRRNRTGRSRFASSRTSRATFAAREPNSEGQCHQFGHRG